LLKVNSTKSRYIVHSHKLYSMSGERIRVRVDGETRCGLFFDIIYTNDNLMYISVAKKKSTAYMHNRPNSVTIVLPDGEADIEFIKEHTREFLRWDVTPNRIYYKKNKELRYY